MNIRNLNKREVLESLYKYYKTGEKDEIIIGSFSDDELGDYVAMDEFMSILADDVLKGGNN